MQAPRRRIPPAPARRTARIPALTLALCTAAAASCLSAGVANAADFYTPPAQFAAEPGSIVKTEPVPVLTVPPGANGQWPAAAQRVMYTSRTQNGDAVPVSGVFLDANHPWQGSGPRPTIVIAPGTVGQGDQCAVSKAISAGVYADPAQLSLSANQEAVSALAWNSLGARVFITDYIGMGTPGIHTYTNRVEEAHAVLDAARAANNLSGSGPATPVAFWGYSQGGGATAAAAELQPDYAPELDLKGTWAGAPPADLGAVIGGIDGNLIGAAIGFALNGFVDRYPDLRGVLDQRTSPSGRALLGELSNECIADVIVKHPFARTTDFTADHRPLIDHMREIPEAEKILADQRIGTLRPSAPVFVTSGINDDTIPYKQARQLADDWCAAGATVTFRSNPLPPIAPGTVFGNHFGPELIDGFGTNNAVSYLMDRLADKPVPGCTFD
ncbi:dienelactone hydrolase [Nocardia transvalensis]|uniref:Dienelactone hydrolase n=1 Tax=Nocardia transvalensis TaxID=37333 RepID=A0A7W9UJQ4_9NOCA|nr:lipase family protein [Nocardia transvalensis]MBB5915601.1 dienelactone hydrolase [Nocardia transvalensis]